MAQTRLINYTREAIEGRAIKAAFDAKEAAQAATEDALTREAYAAVFSAEEIRQAEALPKNWLRRDPCLNFNVNGFTIRLQTKDEGLPVPYRSKGSSGYGCHSSLGVILAGDLADRIMAHAKAKEELEAAKVSARHKLRALLGSVSTIQKLESVWPEGKDFYSMYEEKPAALPPAIRIQDINDALGLS